MLKITSAPNDAIQAQKSFSVSGVADSDYANKKLKLTIDNQVTVKGVSITNAGTWHIDLAFKLPGYHRLEIEIENEKVELVIDVVDEVIEQRPKDILAFYLGQQPDFRGRMIEDIWSWDYQKLESVHDYIQWLFPLRERSQFNRNAPTLTDEVIQAFKTNESLRVRLFKSLKVMLQFYGLQCTKWGDANVEINKSPEYEARKKEWITIRNHNYLRLTRILTCLKNLGLEVYAQAFFQCLDLIYKEENKSIGNETYTYWKNAVD